MKKEKKKKEGGREGDQKEGTSLDPLEGKKNSFGDEGGRGCGAGGVGGGGGKGR